MLNSYLSYIILGSKVIPVLNKITVRTKSDVETAAELLCDLTRMCNIKEAHFASGFNLTSGEFRLLKLFAFRNEYSIKELCGLLNLTPGRITHLVSSLEKKKLILRKINKTDKRNVTITLNSAGRVYIQNVFQSHIRFHKSILAKVSKTQKKVMIGSLQILVDAFRKWIASK
jgi:DNA-binding MarR family transcriptional regulator